MGSSFPEPVEIAAFLVCSRVWVLTLDRSIPPANEWGAELRLPSADLEQVCPGRVGQGGTLPQRPCRFWLNQRGRQRQIFVLLWPNALSTEITSESRVRVEWEVKTITENQPMLEGSVQTAAQRGGSQGALA